jgi:hypothetical protein
MATATITLTDDADGKITVGADFGEQVENESQAHQMALVLIQSVLTNAKNYTTIEDTAPEVDVEPSRIITNEGAT